MKIANEVNGLIRLILRSPDIGDGWREISGYLSNSVESWIAKAPELFEAKQNNGLRVRLSEHGKIVAGYM